MDVPTQWRSYPCEEYLSSHLATEGYWDERAQLWVIEPADRVEEQAEAEFLQVGRPGVDGVGFGYRKNRAGFWAFHRLDREFQYLAPTITGFVKGWYDSSIVL